jgi:hypothetical protein
MNDFTLLPECPPTLRGKRRFYCPSRNEQNEWICVTSEQICDSRIDCPNGHDEEELMCFYHRPVSSTVWPSNDVPVEIVCSMALPVMGFQDQGYKIRKVFHKNQHTQRKLLNYENSTNGEHQ